MKHFVRSVLVAVTLLSIPALSNPGNLPSVPAEKQKTVNLRVGGTKILKANGMNRLAIGDPEIVGIDVPDKGVIKITGKQAGETMLVVWVGDSEIQAYRLVVQD